ncbi:MAG TPA: response regulator [Draconibacterium sp.]|nr:response regulator [Draconibacterium sp.]
MTAKKNYLIYVVEDNRLYNKLIRDYLEKNNYLNVKSFYSSDECIQSLKGGIYPDIVLQDYYMDKMNGIDILRKVKKLHPGSEFIFLTGNESIDVVVNSIKYGAFDYIIKNEFALDKVGDKIEKIIRIKELEKNSKQIRKYKIAFAIVLFLIVIASILVYVVNIFGVQ